MSILPRVSVIVPVYNAENTIEECINSLFGLNYPKEKIELIFINNASTDRTTNILNQYSSKIKILHEEKKGAAAARNKGLLSAKGDFVAFTDSDGVVDKDWIRNIVSPLQNDRVGIVGGKILAKRPCNKIEEFGEIIHDLNKAINEYKHPYVTTGNWASRLSTLKQVGFFDESLIRSQDVDLSYRISKAGYKIVYKPDAITYHRNEKTLFGLFQEGFVHGFHSVKVIKKYKEFLKQFGHRKFNLKHYKELLSLLFSIILKQKKAYAICYFTFNLGKKIGKFFGSLRFLHLDL